MIDPVLLEQAAAKVAGMLPPPFGTVAPYIVALLVDVYQQLEGGTPLAEVKMAPLPDHLAVVAQLLAGDAPPAVAP